MSEVDRDAWLFGVCIKAPDGERPGWIEPLGSLTKNPGNEFAMEYRAEELQEFIGPTGRVFWPQSPPARTDFAGAIVRFRCYVKGDSNGFGVERDWLTVRRVGVEWEVHPYGYRILDSAPHIQWQNDPRWICSRTEGERVFIREFVQNRLIGPWRVGASAAVRIGARKLEPIQSLEPRIYPVRSLDDATNYFSGRVHPRDGHQKIEFLHRCPDGAHGPLVDLATRKQIANWIVERIESFASQFIIRLDEETPGWRRRFKEEIEASSRDDRAMHLDRWSRIESIVDALAFDGDQTRRLIQSSRFQSILDAALTAEIEVRTKAMASEITTAAERLAEEQINRQEERIDQAKKVADESILRTQEKVADAEARIQEARSHLARLDVEIQTRKHEWDERERAIAVLTAHWEESRERLARDVVLYQSLLPKAPTPTSSLIGNATSEPPVQLVEPPIVSEAVFVRKRLWPLLAARIHGLPRVDAMILHAAVYGVKATLIPSPAWARAYADALGGTGRLTFVNVHPTWLGFEDLWNGGLSRCWERASRGESTIELVLLRDFNRALPQCYARPLLDLIAGYADALPSPASGGWPSRLRILACPASPIDSLPLTTEVVQHFAAIRRDSTAQDSDKPDLLEHGHVPAGRWVVWGGNAATTNDVSKDLVRDFGPLASMAASDVAAIARRLSASGMAIREANAEACEMRISEPLSYLDEVADLSKGLP